MFKGYWRNITWIINKKQQANQLTLQSNKDHLYLPRTSEWREIILRHIHICSFISVIQALCSASTQFQPNTHVFFIQFCIQYFTLTLASFLSLSSASAQAGCCFSALYEHHWLYSISHVCDLLLMPLKTGTHLRLSKFWPSSCLLSCFSLDH